MHIHVLYTHTYIVMYYNMYIYRILMYQKLILVKYYGLSENCSIGCLPSIEEIYKK